MSFFTDVLVRYQDGWAHVSKATAPVRKCVCQGQPGDTSEAIRRAEADIATFGTGQVERTVGIDIPVGKPVPGIDWAEGDELFVDGAWLEAETWAFDVDDDTGRWSDVPQFGAVFDTPEQRNARAIRHIGGLAAGTSKLARPIEANPPPDVRPDQIVDDT